MLASILAAWIFDVFFQSLITSRQHSLLLNKTQKLLTVMEHGRVKQSDWVAMFFKESPETEYIYLYDETFLPLYTYSRERTAAEVLQHQHQIHRKKLKKTQSLRHKGIDWIRSPYLAKNEKQAASIRWIVSGQSAEKMTSLLWLGRGGFIIFLFIVNLITAFLQLGPNWKNHLSIASQGFRFSRKTSDVPFADRGELRRGLFNEEKKFREAAKDESNRLRDKFLKPEYTVKPESPEPTEAPEEKPEASLEREIKVEEKVGEPVKSDGSFKHLQKEKNLLEQEMRELGLLRELNLASNSLSKTEDFLRAVATLLRGQFRTSKVLFFLPEENDPQSLKLKGEMRDYQFKSYTEAHVYREEERIPKHSAEGKILFQLRGTINRIGTDSVLSIPLPEKGKLSGAVRMYRNHLEAFQDKEKRLLSMLAKHIATSLNNVLLYQTAVTDALTGLYSYRHFQTILKEEIHKARRYRDDMALVMLDVDHFKSINDQYGHPAGDQVLRELANILQKNIRETDYCFRVGGEEFALLLLRINTEQALQNVEKIRTELQNTAIQYEDKKFRISVSAGVSVYSDPDIDTEKWIKQADTALYQAKNNGRNCVRQYFPSRGVA